MASINLNFLNHPLAQRLPKTDGEFIDFIKVLVDYTASPAAVDIAISDSMVTGLSQVFIDPLPSEWRVETELKKQTDQLKIAQVMGIYE